MLLNLPLNILLSLILFYFIHLTILIAFFHSSLCLGSRMCLSSLSSWKLLKKLETYYGYVKYSDRFLRQQFRSLYSNLITVWYIYRERERKKKIVLLGNSGRAVSRQFPFQCRVKQSIYICYLVNKSKSSWS